MEKILSVCVPSYNMEQYLARNIESFLVSECMDKIEVIVVNDGSKDNTLKIANDFKEKYPETVVVVDKENGHYGSCVNAALKIAKGKYFRLVDADDWVETKNLKTVISEMQKVNVDCFFTEYAIVIEGEDDIKTIKTDNIEYGKIINLHETEISEQCLVMHNLSFRTSLLKDIGYVQTEGVCYTDTEYVYIPFINSKTMYASRCLLYIYLLGRNGQTMDQRTMKNNFNHFRKVYDKIVSTDIPNNNAFAKRIHNIFTTRIMDYMATLAFLFNNDIESQKLFKDRYYEMSINEKNILNSKKIRGLPYIKMIMNGGLVNSYIIAILRAYYKLKLS